MGNTLVCVQEVYWLEPRKQSVNSGVIKAYVAVKWHVCVRIFNLMLLSSYLSYILLLFLMTEFRLHFTSVEDMVAGHSACQVCV